MSATLNKRKSVKNTKAIDIAKKYFKGLNETDDARLTAAASADPDNQLLDEHFFKNAKRGRPFLEEGKKKVPVTIRLDPDIVAHFKAEGKGWQGKMNDVLRKATGLL